MKQTSEGETLLPSIVRASKKYPEKLPLREARGILAEVLSAFDECFIILDGLDKYVPLCGERIAPGKRHELFAIASEAAEGALHSPRATEARIMVSSREHMGKYFPGQPSVRIYAEDKDVRNYVSHHIMSDGFEYSGLLETDPESERRIVDTIVNRTNGQYACLHLTQRFIC